MNDPKRNGITVIGAGLAGAEAAWQISQFGIPVRLFEMKPHKKSPAHHADTYAELVCSNSLRADQVTNGVGLLKHEMRLLDSLIIRCADATRVPAGGALAVDRDDFSNLVTQSIKDNNLITVINEEVKAIPDDGIVIVATGPLTDEDMYRSILNKVGDDALHFFDAAAPIIHSESIDRSVVFAASRYGKGGDDYLNSPMNKEEYDAFYYALIEAELADVKDFDKETVFEGCMPIETMAKRGYDTIRFGPLKPVGLLDPRSGEQPYACIQLRQDNHSASMYNIVGFQTRLKFKEQERVFRMIPGLQNAEFFRYGVMHRNTYLRSPKVLTERYNMITDSNVYLAGQITGVEGYVESAGSGLLAGIYAATQYLEAGELDAISDQTMLGAMASYISDPEVSKRFQPMNANFGVIPPMDRRIKNKKERYEAYAERALAQVSIFKENISRLQK